MGHLSKKSNKKRKVIQKKRRNHGLNYGDIKIKLIKIKINIKN